MAIGLVSRRLALIGGFLYVGVPAFALISLSWVWEILVFWVFIVTWATDILAYFAVRAIGGPCGPLAQLYCDSVRAIT